MVFPLVLGLEVVFEASGVDSVYSGFTGLGSVHYFIGLIVLLVGGHHLVVILSSEWIAAAHVRCCGSEIDGSVVSMLNFAFHRGVAIEVHHTGTHLASCLLMEFVVGALPLEWETVVGVLRVLLVHCLVWSPIEKVILVGGAQRVLDFRLVNWLLYFFLFLGLMRSVIHFFLVDSVRVDDFVFLFGIEGFFGGLFVFLIEGSSCVVLIKALLVVGPDLGWVLILHIHVHLLPPARSPHVGPVVVHILGVQL